MAAGSRDDLNLKVISFKEKKNAQYVGSGQIGKCLRGQTLWKQSHSGGVLVHGSPPS